MILYLEAEKRNFIDKFLNHNPGFYMRPEDGKIDWAKRSNPYSPWIHTKHAPNQKCHFMSQVLFENLYGQSKVPIWCQRCWKVVFMPRTLKELMATYLMQRELDMPSKCGVEGSRENTDRLYGAYFYSQSKEQGLECYKAVKKEVERGRIYEGNILGVPVKANFMNKGDTLKTKAGNVTIEGLPKLILKRGCTEMEQHCGASDKWDWDEEQEEFENIAMNAFNMDIPFLLQPPSQIAKIIQMWIHSAFQWGDQTYLEYTNGNRLYSGPVTYHMEDEDNGKSSS